MSGPDGKLAGDSVSRRSFLRGGARLGGAAAAGLAAPAVLAQSPVVVRMQTSWSPADIYMDFARQYVERVDAMSGGRLAIELLPAGSVVGPFEVIDAVHEGSVEAAHSLPVYWYSKHKAASLFGAGPVFGGDATTMLGWYYSGGGADLYRELTQDILGLNVYGLFGFPVPAEPFGWFRQPVTGRAQLQGLKYRTVGLAAELMEKLGVSVVQLPAADIVPAMERGDIDAFEYAGPSHDLRFGAQNVAGNYMLSSYHQATEIVEFLFNRDFFDGLDDDLRAILRYGVEASATANTVMALDGNSADLRRLQDGGTSVQRTSLEILDAQLEAWDEIIAELETDPFAGRVLDSQRAWFERVAYYELMNAADLVRAYEHHFPGRLKL